ncbi:DUF4167 domain-containing protein [Seohaeicola saemankumensis]|uniref:DUF4167 domain-containing protein n=1 Tax=Seohaeicola TaxID=481178 RepID=UPI0035CFEA61
MRSSKSRSRKSGRNNAPNRSVGNIINRVFDSSGPEGKVRGTPQQIIDKYNQLARDAQLGNDRVAMENFQQHAEHYLRLLAEAQREIDQRREQQERENRDRQSERDQQQAQQGQRDQSRDQGREQGRDQARDQRDQTRERQPRQDQDTSEQPAEQRRDTRRQDQADRDEGASQDVLDLGGDSGLVDTPESKSEQPAAKPAGRARGESRPKAEGDDQPKPKPRSRAPRKPREPRAEGGETPGSSEAAE